MKITRIETFKYWVDWCNWLFVKVATDEGLYGWGEGSLHGAIESVETAIHEFAPHLIGQDPAGPGAPLASPLSRLALARRRGLQTALAALDIALWDLEGKRLGVPVARLLGGAFSARSCAATRATGCSGAETPEQAHDGAQEAVRRGFTAFKCSPFYARGPARQRGGGDLRSAADADGRGARRRRPDAEIFIECSEFLSPRTARAARRAPSRPTGPGWFEEPIPFENAAAMVAACSASCATPIATGERLLSRWEYRELLEEGGCRIVQPDLMHARRLHRGRARSRRSPTPITSR